MFKKIKDKLESIINIPKEIMGIIVECKSIFTYYITYSILLILINLTIFVFEVDNDIREFIVLTILNLSIITMFMKNIIDETRIKHELENNMKTSILSNKITSIFAQNIDHQLKTPLTSLSNNIEKQFKIIDLIKSLAVKDGKRDIDKLIYGCTEDVCNTKCGIKQTCDSKEARKLINSTNDIQNDIQESLNLISKTLDLIKENKNMRNNNGKDMYHLLLDILNSYKSIVKYKFNYKISDALKGVYLDGMDNISFINIISNNIQNSLDAKSTFIMIKEVKITKTYTQFVIIDNGDGIPEDKVDKIFELSYSTKGENRGFGMYLCKTLLKEHGGSISVIDTGPQGTSMLIQIKTRKDV